VELFNIQSSLGLAGTAFFMWLQYVNKIIFLTFQYNPIVSNIHFLCKIILE
jgi:hypothetical protein